MRGVGLFDFLRGKQDEDPILGGRSSEPTGLEVTPVEDTQAWSASAPAPADGTQSWTSSSTTRIDASSVGDAPMDPASLIRTLQEAGGDPDKLVAELRELFPGAQIDVQQQSYGTDPAQLAQTFFTGGSVPPTAMPGQPSGDPLDQIERLAELHRSGALTDAEFAAAKAKLLGA